MEHLLVYTLLSLAFLFCIFKILESLGMVQIEKRTRIVDKRTGEVLGIYKHRKVNKFKINKSTSKISNDFVLHSDSYIKGEYKILNDLFKDHPDESVDAFRNFLRHRLEAGDSVRGLELFSREFDKQSNTSRFSEAFEKEIERVDQ